MSLHPTMRRRLHERLHPLIGDEEAEALLDQIPDDPVTKQWLTERFTRIDERFTHIDQRLDVQDQRFITKDWADERFVTKEHLDAKLEGLDHKMEGMEHRITGEMHRALTQQTHRVYGAAGLFALIISIVDRIWG